MIRADFESAFHTFMVANTPRFLFSRLRADSNVQGLARTVSVDELVAAAKKYVAASGTPEFAALAYAMLVALSLKDSDEARRAIDDVDVKKLEWGERIRTMMKESAVRVETVTASPAVQITTRKVTRGMGGSHADLKFSVAG